MNLWLESLTPAASRKGQIHLPSDKMTSDVGIAADLRVKGKTKLWGSRKRSV